MSRYVASGYWNTGYAEGDVSFVYAAASADAASDVDAGARIFAYFGVKADGASTTTVSPFRVQQSAAKVTTNSDTDISAGLKLFVGNLMSAEGSALASAGLNMATGAKSAATGALKISGRIKWEAEAEPGDTWTSRIEASGVWTDRIEPGDTWTSRPEVSGIWTDRPEPGDTWSNY